MPTNPDSYFTFWPELLYPIFYKISTLSNCDLPLLEYSKAGIKTAVPVDKIKLFYHVDKVIKVYRLYISLLVIIEIITLTHGTDHLRFSQCFEIITCSWFIQDLTQIFWSYIKHYPQYLALQT